MIEISSRNDKESYIRYTGTSMDEYYKFTEILGEIQNKYYDYNYGLWICDAISAQKIQDKLNNIHIGERLKLSPYDYQRQAIAYCLSNSGGLLTLPCGAGKTPIGLGVFDELIKCNKIQPIGVFVVKASLKTQWLKEVSKFTNYSAKVVNTFKAETSKISNRIRSKEKQIKSLSKKDAFEHSKEINILTKECDDLRQEAEQVFVGGFDPKKYQVFIINYETLADDKVRECLHQLKPDFFYVDEADCIKDPSTKRSKNLREFISAKYKYGATATPIRKNPKDLYGIFSFILPSLFPSERDFDNRFLKKWYGRVTGSKNEEELSRIIKPHCFSRTYEQIADQLPQQTIVQMYCELTPKQIEMTKYLMELKDEATSKMEALAMRLPPNMLETNAEYQTQKGLVSAYQTFAQELADDERLLKQSESNMAHKFITGASSSKLNLCMELVQKIIDSNEKVVIFSKYIPMQDFIIERLQKLKDINEYSWLQWSQIYGAISDQKRAEVLDTYNNTNEQRVLLLSDAGEAGLNLSTTKYMIEFELADSAAKQTQRHGRTRRADSIHKNLFVYQLIAQESYDEIAQMIVNKKTKYSQEILK